MKKILLSLGLFGLVLSGNSQTVLNEVYTDPGAGHEEFMELYNSGAGAQNVDCFTILTYWSAGADKGWYVLDLPSLSLSSKGYFTLSSGNPFSTQNNASVVPNLNWNDATFRGGTTGGYLEKFQVNGGTYTDLNLPAGTAVTDLLVDGDFASSHNYLTLVFVNGVFSNGFWGGGASGTLPASITGMPDLTLTRTGLAGVCGAGTFTVDFSTLGAVEHVNQSGGSNNGYARTKDGKCGAWEKTSAGVTHTPGSTNNIAAGNTVGVMATTEILFCNSLPNATPKKSHVSFDITGIGTSDVTEADDFPVEVQLYYDYPPLAIPATPVLGPEDIYQRSKFQATIAGAADTFQIVQTQYVILVYRTQRGCFDKTVGITNGCIPLPVNFKSFTANRNHSNVMLKWETASELNNSGFAIERNVNGTWQQIAWVPSQASGGNSETTLSYSYSDLNNTKGISQYRIRQVDIDARSKYSEVRSVRGEGQLGKTIVYPNPSNNGKVNVVFEDASVTREVTVADMSGRTVRQMKGVTNNNITIENLNPGMYTIRIVAVETGEQVVEKIVVNKR